MYMYVYMLCVCVCCDRYMDTMMGVKQSLDPSLEAELGLIRDSAPRYSLWHKFKLILSTIHKSMVYM